MFQDAYEDNTRPMDWTWLDKKESIDDSMNVEIKLKRGESLLFEVEESMMQNALEEGFAKIDEL